MSVQYAEFKQFLALSAKYTSVTPDPAGGNGRDKRDKIILRASEGCVPILLRQHPAFTSYKQDPHITLEIFDRASHLLLITETHYPGKLGNHLLPILSESLPYQISVFTSLLVSACTTDADDGRASSLISLYPVLARVITSTLRQVADLLVISSAEAAGKGAEGLSGIFIITRLALLLPKSCGAGQEEKDAVLGAFWMGISIEWTRLISLTLGSLCVNTVSSIQSISKTR